jgi:hypothetical protein
LDGVILPFYTRKWVHSLSRPLFHPTEIDLSIMDETTRKAFCLNVYNLFISYAFIKMGIATNSLRRGAFFERIKINLGGELLSFNDLENGILRANARHPFASKLPFDQDRQDRLSLSRLDCRIHFALNCGAKSCPPIRFFRPETLEEELDIVSRSFCEGDDVISVKMDLKELHLSMLLKWFQTDFCETREQLPQTILPFLRGAKHQAVTTLVAHEGSTGITIRFLPYDWSTMASNHKAFLVRHLKANEYNPTALFHLPRRCHLGLVKASNRIQLLASQRAS